jgi:hypothetical protein
MKYHVYLALIASVSTMKLNGTPMLVQKYKSMKMEQLQEIVDEAVKKNSLGDTKPATKEEAATKSAEYKAVEDALATRIADKLKGAGTWGPYYYPLGTYWDSVSRMRHYHDMVLGYDSMYGLPYYPSGADSWSNDLSAILDAYAKQAGAPAAKKDDAPAKAALMQTEVDGVPVYVNPTLMANTMGGVDLH